MDNEQQVGSHIRYTLDLVQLNVLPSSPQCVSHCCSEASCSAVYRVLICGLSRLYTNTLPNKFSLCFMFRFMCFVAVLICEKNVQ